MQGNNMKIKKVLIYPIIAFITTTLYASLSFKTTTIEEVVSRNSEDYSFSFSFKNKGKAPVRIIDIITSCGCTTVSCDKLIYLPSEEGKLNGKFIVGNLTGLQEKDIIVKTDSISSPSVTLQLKLFIPASISIRPSILVWRLHEPYNAKNVKVKINPASNLNFKNISYDSNLFNIIVRKISEIEYELSITPTKIDNMLHKKLSINYTDADNIEHNYIVHLLCK